MTARSSARFNMAAFRATPWTEYATRFLFGGSVTVLAGLIADKFGPAVGGLFLAFPAIFPASASLIDKQKRDQSPKSDASETKASRKRRGRRAAGADAVGAAMGALGLMTFAVAAWRLLPQRGLSLTLTCATLAWAGVSLLAWVVGRKI